MGCQYIARFPSERHGATLVRDSPEHLQGCVCRSRYTISSNGERIHRKSRLYREIRVPLEEEIGLFGDGCPGSMIT